MVQSIVSPIRSSVGIWIQTQNCPIIGLTINIAHHRFPPSNLNLTPQTHHWRTEICTIKFPTFAHQPMIEKTICMIHYSLSTTSAVIKSAFFILFRLLYTPLLITQYLHDAGKSFHDAPLCFPKSNILSMDLSTWLSRFGACPDGSTCSFPYDFPLFSVLPPFFSLSFALPHFTIRRVSHRTQLVPIPPSILITDSSSVDITHQPTSQCSLRRFHHIYPANPKDRCMQTHQ